MKKIKHPNDMIGKMIINVAFGIVLMEIAGAVTYILDGIFTSRFIGDTALAASGIASVSFTILAIVSGVISSGAQKICCSEMGAGRRDRANQIFSMTLLITGVLSLILALAGILFAAPLASLMGASKSNEELYMHAVDYIRGFFIGAPGHIFVAVLIPFVQLEGKNKTITGSIIALTIADIVADLLNVMVFHGGMFGMGLATSISYYVNVAVLITAFMSKEALLKLDFSTISFEGFGEMLHIGMPRATKRFGNFFRAFFINRMIIFAGGSVAMTSFTVQQNLSYFVGSISVGIGSAAFLLIGMFMGEKDFSSLHKTGSKTIRYIITIIGCTAVLCIIAAPILTKLYITPDSPAYQDAIFVLRCYAVSLPFLAFNEYYISICQATNRYKLTHIITLLNKLVIIVSISYIMMKAMGTTGLWIALPLSEIIMTVGILLCNAPTTRNNPNRRSVWSLFDDRNDQEGSELEVTVQAASDLTRINEQIAEYCERNSIEKDMMYKIQLYFEEVCVLVMEHGFSDGKEHRIYLRLYKDKENLYLRSKDDCRAFSLSEQAQMGEKADFSDKYLGINVVVKMAKKVDYVHVMNINSFIVKI